MKTKLKKWHIALMSFVALMLAVFTSLFNLKADPVDEETGEVLTDNWELGIVFYDSTVDNGKTPLTKISWDASNGSYSSGTPRVITVQINYKNTNAVTTYQPGELEITIPNLIYSNKSIKGTAADAQWTTSVLVGANDSTHSGYDWNFALGNSPGSTYEYYKFTNANIIEEKSNFEGSIQIQYTITPASEYPEYTEECIHDYSKTIQAKLNIVNNKGTCQMPEENVENTIKSTFWPYYYDNNMSTSRYFWEYTSPNLENLEIVFDPTSKTEAGWDFIYIYDKTGECKYVLSGEYFSEEIYQITGNYVKFAMSSDSNTTYKGFMAYIGSNATQTPANNIITSNTLSFDYTRTYIHPWKIPTYSITKNAYKLTSLDGLPQGDYYWVKYLFTVTPSISFSRQDYPYIRSTYYIEDTFPEDVVVVDSAFNQLSLENGYYYDNAFINNSYSGSTHSEYVYVGYPKSIYNEAAGTTNITNHVDLYVKHNNETEYSFADDDEISFNLVDFEFTYSGNLYGLTKSTPYSQYSSHYYQNLTGERTTIGLKGVQNWYLTLNTKYTGQKYDVKFGDDLMYITRNDGTVQRLADSEYFISQVNWPGSIKNGNGQIIATNKYNCEMWVRYANSDNYVLFEEFTHQSKTWTLTKNQGIVGVYFIMKDLEESIIFSASYNNCVQIYTTINNAVNIPQTGTFYNFSFLQVYINNELQNEPELNSYSSFLSQLEIATFDQNTYGKYMQRSYNSVSYKYFELFKLDTPIDIKKTMSTFSQNAADEIFTGRATLSLTLWNNPIPEGFGYGSGSQLGFTASDYLYFIGDTLPEEQGLKGWEIIDLLPEGMDLTTTAEEIKNNMEIRLINMCYTIDKKQITSKQFINLVEENTTITITEDYNGTGRTRIRILVDLTENPLFFLDFSHGNNSGDYMASYPYNYAVSYDSFLEYGSVWENTGYFFFYGNKLNDMLWSSSLDLTDINNDNNTSEVYGYEKTSATINSIVSTHQDVTKYVKTDFSGYATNTVDASYDSEYEYKLRVRTGAANITNLIIYDVLETAQPERTRWQGEFLGTDTSYAESKTYKLYKPEDPNSDANGYVPYNLKVNTFYSESTEPGDLYNEDGSFNNNWKEYKNDIPEKRTEGLEIKFNSNSYTSSSYYDYLTIIYFMDGNFYFVGSYGGSQLRNLTVQIPTDNFYLTWKTDASANSYYGFSIDSITSKNVEGHTGTRSSFSAEEIEEITGSVYPDSNWDGEHPHGNYGANINKTWHYTYNGEKEIIQEFVQGTDKTKVKALAFEYVNEDGTPPIIPASHVTYVNIKMKAPADENITTLARNDCRTQWTALDDYYRPVDFITGINSNVVKVALPNSVDEDSVSSITLKFTKEIQGTDSQFDYMQLDKAAQQFFKIKLTSLVENEDGTYNQITAVLKNDQELIISRIPIGTYLLEELGDNYFDFVDFTNNNDSEIIIEGVTLEKTLIGYILTVSEELTENIEFNIKVTNEIEQFRPYEDKNSQENLFLKNKIEENS